MMEPKNLDRSDFIRGKQCLGVTIAVNLKLFDIYFTREASDYLPDPGFTPYFWRKKGGDPGNDNEESNKDGDDNLSSSRPAGTAAKNMEVDSSKTHTSSSTGKTVLASSPVNSGMVYAVTPLNPNPKTTLAKKIVQEARRFSLGLVGSSGNAANTASLADHPVASALRGMARPSTLSAATQLEACSDGALPRPVAARAASPLPTGVGPVSRPICCAPELRQPGPTAARESGPPAGGAQAKVLDWASSAVVPTDLALGSLSAARPASPASSSPCAGKERGI
jgi:hypothetical protein